MWFHISRIPQQKRLQVKGFRRVAYTIEHHLEDIINFFENRSTNASAEALVEQFTKKSLGN